MTDLTPEIGPDGRQRPRFGEYATPEEQRARIQVPDVTAALESGVAPATAAAPPAVAEPAPAAASGPVVRKPRTPDRIATALLLAFGLFNVLTSVPALFDYAGYLEVFLGSFGVDESLTDPGSGAAWGFSAAAVLIAGWVLTALISLRSLRRGRLTFWIPLVGGLVFNTISAVLMIVPIMNDPVLWSALQSAILG